MFVFGLMRPTLSGPNHPSEHFEPGGRALVKPYELPAER